jgi:N-acetylgalactosamine-N,N'-diacetylbacillosaminyl-diphospho-undecaprenol 4-alpha-N-acetylgalactosaminyltransferase
MGSTVVFVVNSLAGGGAERAVVNILARSQAWVGAHDLHLVLLDREEEAYTPPAFVTVHRLDAGGSLPASVRQLGRVLAQLKPAIVVSALSRANIANVLLARLRGHRTILCEHNYTTGKHKGLSGRAAKALIRVFYPRADLVVGVSQGIREDLIAHYRCKPARVVAIANPIDVAAIRARGEEALPIAIDRPFLLGMGRFAAHKNFAMLIEAYAASSFPGPLLLLGQGPEREELARTAQRLGVADRVLMPGFLANPFPAVRAAAAYILPSNAEGLPTAIIEALVLGTPVISTNCRTGPSEILDDEVETQVGDVTQARYGLLVPTDDAPAMTRAIDRLADPAIVEDLQTLAAAGATRYSLDAPVRQYWQLIDAALGASDEVQGHTR